VEGKRRAVRAKKRGERKKGHPGRKRSEPDAAGRGFHNRGLQRPLPEVIAPIIHSKDLKEGAFTPDREKRKRRENEHRDEWIFIRNVIRSRMHRRPRSLLFKPT